MKRILFVGGGTLGPVTPLLAVASALRRLEPKLVLGWVGTPTGPERSLVQAASIPFFDLPVVKWPRYPTLQWLTMPFKWLSARAKAKALIQEWKPDLVVSAGGFTAVPLVYAAAAAGIPCVTHQLDKEPGLANRKIAAKCVEVTTSFTYAESPFPGVKTEQIPTPVRFTLADVPSRTIAATHFGLDPQRPIILVFGGGTGAMGLNTAIQNTLDAWLEFTQVIHSTGAGKEQQLRSKPGYTVKPFIGSLVPELQKDEMLLAYAAADIVIMRAGLGSLSECTSSLQKPTILVPMPNSHQEANAHEFEQVGAAFVVHQESPTFEKELLSTAQELLRDVEERVALGIRAQQILPTDDGTALAKHLLKILNPTK